MKKAKYSIWQNVKYIYSKMWQYSRSLVLYSFARMPINVVLPFLGIYLSSFVVGAVTNKYTPGQIIISISIIMFATLVLNLISLFLSGKIQGLSLGNPREFFKNDCWKIAFYRLWKFRESKRSKWSYQKLWNV